MNVIMASIKYYSEEGLLKLQKELHKLITVDRPAASKQIAEARDKGDLSENAEYDAAKEAQGLLEMKISKLEETIRNARIIDETKLDLSKVSILSIVTIKNLRNNTVMKYTIVPESEANLKEAKISVNSPIAKGLLGREVGDVTEIVVPAGKLNFEIVAIDR
jgi:transcription elongation factor GreA